MVASLSSSLAKKNQQTLVILREAEKVLAFTLESKGCSFLAWELRRLGPLGYGGN